VRLKPVQLTRYANDKAVKLAQILAKSARRITMESLTRLMGVTARQFNNESLSLEL